MRVSGLKIANVRAIQTAEFSFRPGVNLVVGVNGVGKTTVLDTLAVCLSVIAEHANRLPRHGRYFEANDIRVGVGALQAQCGFECAGQSYEYLLHRFRHRSPLQSADEWSRESESAYSDPVVQEFQGGIPTDGAGGPPGGDVLAILYSTGRSVTNERRPRGSAAAGGIAAAFAGALSARPLGLGEFADWMRAQQELSSELPAAEKMLAALDRAVTRFLPDFRDLKPDGDDDRSLVIVRGDVPLPVRSLSDGERGVLAMVLDMTRRLAQANPELDDPAAEAEAVVLIDEIELHLHPAWQRRIVGNLTETFPKCQFIATTHSPQVIGEVKHDRIHIIADGEVYSPPYSYGVDSSRVLEEIMETNSRTESVDELLATISRTVGDDRYDEARSLLTELSDRLGEDAPEVTRIRTLLEFLTGDA